MDQPKEMTAEEISEQMKKTIIVNAKDRPWSWEWKFLTALYLLQGMPLKEDGTPHRRDIKSVKNMLGITYQTLLRWGFIELKKGRYVLSIK